MSSLFPASTNSDYRGQLVSAYALSLLAVGTIVPACIHAFAPDGGAVSIAGLELGNYRTLVVGVFAWAGATQLVWGLMMLLVSINYRSLVPLVLTLILIERTTMALNQWVFKASGAAHHPPGVYGTLAVIPVVVVLLILSLSTRKNGVTPIR